MVEWCNAAVGAVLYSTVATLGNSSNGVGHERGMRREEKREQEKREKAVMFVPTSEHIGELKRLVGIKLHCIALKPALARTRSVGSASEFSAVVSAAASEVVIAASASESNVAGCAVR